MKVAVLAAGSWGTALAMVLFNNGHDVRVWSKDPKQIETILHTRRNENYLPGVDLPEGIKFTSDLQEATCDVSCIVFAVPSQFFKEVLEACVIQKVIGPETLLVNVAKGIDMDLLMTPSQITYSHMPNARFVTLSGPSHAEEVALKLPTALVSASKSRFDAEMVQELFSNAYMRIYTNPDVMGVEISGALKNIIAVGAGISDGLGFGDNAKAALITRGIHEIAQLGMAMGAKSETFKGLAGVGDLIVTCTSMHSRNRRCGILIGQGKRLDEAVQSIGMVVEGAYTIKSAYMLKEKYGVEMPIATELYRILYEGKDAREAVLSLMMRTKKNEMDEFAGNLDAWSE